MKKKVSMSKSKVALVNNPTSALVVAKSLQQQAKPLINKLSHLASIDTEEQYQLAATKLSELKDIGKLAEVEKEKFTGPLNQLLRVTRSHFKPFFDQLESLEGQVKGCMIAFLNKQDEAKKKLEARFEEGKIAKTSTLLRKTEELTVGSGDATVRKVKVVKVVDASLIPRKYLVPDLAAIKAALIDGETVKGCELVLENNIAI